MSDMQHQTVFVRVTYKSGAQTLAIVNDDGMLLDLDGDVVPVDEVRQVEEVVR